MLICKGLFKEEPGVLKEKLVPCTLEQVGNVINFAHDDPLEGGHCGSRAMENAIGRTVVIPHLRELCRVKVRRSRGVGEG